MFKKLIPWVVLAAVLAVAVPVALVSAENTGDLWPDENGKLVGPDVPFVTQDEAYEKEQARLAAERAEQEKFGALTEITSAPLTQQQTQELRAEQQKNAQKAGEYRALFERGREILHRYLPEYPNEVGDSSRVDRHVLEGMVRVLETQSLTQEERLTLLRCLAEHYCGLLGDDPLRPRIDALFSAYEAAAQQ